MRFGIQLQYRHQKRFKFVLRSDSTETKKLITAVPQHAHNYFAHFFFNFSLRWLEGDNFSFCLIDPFFLIKLSMAPHIQLHST